MAHNYLSDSIESTWIQPEHETFALLADRIEDYLNTNAAAAFTDMDEFLATPIRELTAEEKAECAALAAAEDAIVYCDVCDAMSHTGSYHDF